MEFRQARQGDLPQMEHMLQEAKERLRALGIDQWQSGYPNRESLNRDLAAGTAYVLEEQGSLRAMAAILFEEEKTYRRIEGAWKNQEPYMVLHRVCAARGCCRRGYASRLFRQAEELCRARGLWNVRIDTHRGNAPMRRFLEKLGFQECGVIFLKDPGEPTPERIAYQKILLPPAGVSISC